MLHFTAGKVELIRITLNNVVYFNLQLNIIVYKVGICLQGCCPVGMFVCNYVTLDFPDNP